MKNPLSLLECIECSKTYTTQEIRYHCECGGLLEVQHDVDQIKRTNLDLKIEFNENSFSYTP